MARRFAHWVLLFSLLGQFLLTPAMALPDQLHQFGQSYLQEFEQHLQQSAVQLNSEPSITDSRVSPNDASYTHIDPSLFSDNLFNLVADFGEQVNALLCEASCQMLSSGHCTNHSSCAPGLASPCVLSLKQNIGQEQIDGPSWSVKTFKLHVVTPPPIA
ncbi:hypothetical protein L1D44_10275 [Shewanella sp. Isolate13]|uniref:hypothetical protein n=1 Tax=Shewanella sp. Isolate13 TaxID=2908531 RepID=UPI001EFC4293|nr:hypothetical protein [Shewanella sp. Isolate13]MCG9730235.1 hypothetical protein [Shewanella sp. Isolate13]